MAEKKTLDLAPFQVDLLLVFWCFVYTTSSTIDSETKIAVPSYSERKSLYVTFCSFGSRTRMVNQRIPSAESAERKIHRLHPEDMNSMLVSYEKRILTNI